MGVRIGASIVACGIFQQLSRLIGESEMKLREIEHNCDEEFAVKFLGWKWMVLTAPLWLPVAMIVKAVRR